MRLFQWDVFVGGHWLLLYICMYDNTNDIILPEGPEELEAVLKDWVFMQLTDAK